MGAIVAIMGEPGDLELPRRLDRMLARSPYRGTPERRVDGHLALGVQTLGWDASMATFGPVTTAVHGVIGNWSELARDNRWRFPEGASSAVKLAIAYEDHGNALFRELRGEYSILVHDHTSGEITAVRDPWGRRPLFFHRLDGRTYIATEIRQLIAGSESAAEIDPDVLVQALLWRPAYPDRTHVKGVGRIPAGKVTLFRRDETDGPQIRAATWEPPAPAASGRYDLDELTEELRFRINQALSRWMLQLPFGVSLSGGVDSGTLWALIAERARTGDSGARLGRPFSIVREGTATNERAQIERILEATGSQGELVDCPRRDRMQGFVNRAQMMDSPFVGAIYLCPPFLRALNEDGRQLLLTGFGGDLLFAGSPTYHVDLLLRGSVITALHDLLSYRPPKGSGRLKFLTDTAIAPLWRRVKLLSSVNRPAERPGWLHEDRIAGFERSSSDTQRPRGPARELRHRRRLLGIMEVQRSLGAQEGSEQLLASFGVTGGAPLIDLDLVEFALRIPPRAFSHGVQYKHLLRRVAYDRLSEPIRTWVNPDPWFYLDPDEVELLEHALPPPDWQLVRSSVVDPDTLVAMFANATNDRAASADLGNLAVAEVVVRALSCPETSDVQQ